MLKELLTRKQELNIIIKNLPKEQAKEYIKLKKKINKQIQEVKYGKY